MLFLRLCEMAIALFSKQYFKRNFFDTLLLLAKDRVPNIRLKLCGILPRLKSLLSLPSDRGLLQQLEDTIKVICGLVEEILENINTENQKRNEKKV
jgi:serine/threonine-protein phosphatase 4 regulatory subunit 4